MKLMREPLFGGGEQILDLPMWCPPRTERGTYWHIPRSAQTLGPMHSRNPRRWRWLRERYDGEEISVSFWCGQSGRAIRQALVDTIPEDKRCGTCVGRYLGATRTNGVIFSPRDHWALPKWCPGGEREEGGRVCFACGGKVRYRYSPYYAAGEARHRPEPALSRYEPCPEHGWSKVSRGWDRATNQHVDELVCTMHGCSHQGIPLRVYAPS